MLATMIDRLRSMQASTTAVIWPRRAPLNPLAKTALRGWSPRVLATRAPRPAPAVAQHRATGSPS